MAIRPGYMRPIIEHPLAIAIAGGVITLLCSALLVMLTGAWATKENAADHRNDLTLVRADIQRVLDAVCIDRQNAPVCRVYGGGTR